MPRLFNQFTADTISASPSGFVQSWSVHSTLAVAAGGGLGGKVATGSTPDPHPLPGSHHAHAWTTPGTFADGQVFGLVVPGSGGSGEQEAGICVRLQGTAGTSATYRGYYLVADEDVLILCYRTGTSTSTLATVAFPFAPSSRICMVLEAVGTTIRGRAWIYGTTEPATWPLSVTHGLHTAAGYAGIIFRQPTVTHGAPYWEAVSYGVGTPAPTTPPAGPAAPVLSSLPALVAPQVGLTWTAASDPDALPGDVLTYAVEYQVKDDAGWTSVTSGITALTYTWDATAHVAEVVRVRVRATDPDGIAGAWAESGYFAINPLLQPSAADLAVMADPHCHIYARVRIENAAGVMVEYANEIVGLNRFVRAAWVKDVDAQVETGTVDLWLDEVGGSLAPLVEGSPLNEDAGGDYAPAIDAARRIEIDGAYTLRTAPTESDWIPVVVGRTDKPDWTGSGIISVSWRDLGAWLQERKIREVRTYSDSAGIPIGELIQQIIDDNPVYGSPVVYVIGDPDVYIEHLEQPRDVSVMDAGKALASEHGLDFRYLPWHDGVHRLTLYRPFREVEQPVAVLTPGQYLEVTAADLDEDQVRTRFEIPWSNAAGVPQEPYVRVNASAETRYRTEKYMRLGKEHTRSHTTLESVVLLADALEADLAVPPFTHGVKLRFFPWAQINEYYGFAPNGVHYDVEQRLAGVKIEHRLESASGYTSISGSGQPRGAYRTLLTRGVRGTNNTIDVSPLPVVRQTVESRSPTSITYRLTGSAENGDPVTMYVAHGNDPLALTTNPAFVTFAKDSVDYQTQTARYEARSRGGTTPGFLGATYDPTPGFIYAPAPVPIFSENEVVGWEVQRTMNDDARGLRLRILSGSLTLASSTPAAEQVEDEFWIDVDAEKLVRMSLLQSPGGAAVAELTPFEFYGPAVAAGATVEDMEDASGSEGVPQVLSLRRAPVTTCVPDRVTTGTRSVTFTPNPPGCTLRFQLNGAGWVVVPNVLSAHTVTGIDVSGVSVLVEFYSTSPAGVAEEVRRTVIDGDTILQLTEADITFVEDPANTLNVSGVFDDETFSWSIWGVRGDDYPADRAGNPLRGTLIAENQASDPDTSFYAGGDGGIGSTWSFIIRARDKDGYFAEVRKQVLVMGAASSLGYLRNVRTRLAEEAPASGIWYNDILWDVSAAIDADPADYTVDVLENGVLLVAGRRADYDHDQANDGSGGTPTLGLGGFHRRVLPATPGQPYANTRTFTYFVTLYHLGVEVGTYSANITGLYLGTGVWEEAPAVVPSGLALSFPDGGGGVLATWTDPLPSALTDIEWQKAYFVGSETGGEVWTSSGVEEVPVGATTHLLTLVWAGWRYRARVRKRTNGGAGAWTDFAVTEPVPSGSAGGSGGGGGTPPGDYVT